MRRKQKHTRCNQCRFFHGDNNIVCALHPSGKEFRRCPDYEASPLRDRIKRMCELPPTKGVMFFVGTQLTGMIAFINSLPLLLGYTPSLSLVLRSIRVFTTSNMFGCLFFLGIAILFPLTRNQSADRRLCNMLMLGAIVNGAIAGLIHYVLLILH
jgi:hypothetical protein